MGLGDAIEVEEALGIEPPRARDAKIDPDVGSMLSGILAAIDLMAPPDTEERTRDRVVVTIEADRRGYFKATERVTHLEGDGRTLDSAVRALYGKLRDRAVEDERKASARLERLGARR